MIDVFDIASGRWVQAADADDAVAVVASGLEFTGDGPSAVAIIAAVPLIRSRHPRVVTVTGDRGIAMVLGDGHYLDVDHDGEVTEYGAAVKEQASRQ